MINDMASLWPRERERHIAFWRGRAGLVVRYNPIRSAKRDQIDVCKGRSGRWDVKSISTLRFWLFVNGNGSGSGERQWDYRTATYTTRTFLVGYSIGILARFSAYFPLYQFVQVICACSLFNVWLRFRGYLFFFFFLFYFLANIANISFSLSFYFEMDILNCRLAKLFRHFS